MLGFFITRRHKGHEGFFGGGIARVYLTTEYTEHTERHSSAVSREDAKIGGRVSPRAAWTRQWRASVPTSRLDAAMEGECPHEPPGRGNGGRVSPRAAFRCAEGWFQGFIAEHREGQASACPRTSRRSSLPGGGHAATRARHTPLHLRVKKTDPPKPFAFCAFFAAITVAMLQKSAASAKSADQKNRALPETKER